MCHLKKPESLDFTEKIYKVGFIIALCWSLFVCGVNLVLWGKNWGKSWGIGKMDNKQYDTVLLKDGRTGSVVEVFPDDSLIVDVGSSPADWETLYDKTVDDIEKVINDNKKVVMCPLMESEIDDGICFDIHMNVEGLAPDWTIPDEVLKIADYKQICLKCPNHRED